jgi:hypothetical protein
LKAVFLDIINFIALTMTERFIDNLMHVEGWRPDTGLQLDSTAGIVLSGSKFAKQSLSIGKYFNHQTRTVSLEGTSNGDWIPIGDRLQVVHPIEIGITKFPDGSYTSALFAHGVMTSDRWRDIVGDTGDHFAYLASPGETEAYVVLNDGELKQFISESLAEELGLK